MRPACVVLLTEVLDHDAGFGEGPQLLAVEALVAESAVKAFHDAILPGASGVDVDGADALFRQPALDDVGDEPLAVVGTQVLRGAVRLDGLVQTLQYVFRAQGPIRPQHMALAGILGRISFAFHGLGPGLRPRLSPKAAQKSEVTSQGRVFIRQRIYLLLPGNSPPNAKCVTPCSSCNHSIK